MTNLNKLQLTIPLPPLESRSIYWYSGLLALCMLGAAACCGFHQLHNDFWDCVFIARHMSLIDRQSLFNPQYPIGYTLFLKTIGGPGLPVTPAIIANCVFAALMLLALGFLLRRFIAGRAAAIALVLLAFFPRMFHYCTVGGGDPGSVALFTLGAVMILLNCADPGREPQSIRVFTGGMLLGLAALFRYHVFVGDTLLLFALCLVYRKAWLQFVIAAIGLCVAYSPQWIINLLTGHGLFKTQFGPMNVYDLMYSLNWYRSTSLHLPSSVFAIINSDPLLFAKNYAIAFIKFSPALFFPLAAALTAREQLLRKLCAAIFIWALAYFLLFSAVTSGRQVLLALPLTFFSVAVLLRTTWRYAGAFTSAAARLLKYIVPLFSISALALFCHRDVYKIITRARENIACSNVEACVCSRGCSLVNQVFATDYDIYFKNMPPFTLLSNGGAPRWGTYGVNSELPEFPVDTIESFADACQKRGVRFLVLTSEAEKYSPALGTLYRQGESKYFRPIEDIGRFHVFEVIR